MAKRRSGFQQILLILILIVFVISGCKSSDNNDAHSSSHSIQGKVVKGPVEGAQVYIYALDGQGNRSQLVGGPFITDSVGAWTGTVSSAISGYYEVVSSGGSYLDEASGQTVQFQNNHELNSILDLTNPVVGSSSFVAITPLTHAVVLASKQNVGNSIPIYEAISQGISDAELGFGFDPIAVLPTNPHNPDVEASLQQKQYAAVLGGFSYTLHQNPNLSAFDESQRADLVLALAKDLANGVMDGLGADARPVSLSLNTGQGNMALPVLDSSGLGSLFNAANSFAQTSEVLNDINISTEQYVSFGSEGNRLVNNDLKISINGSGFFVVSDINNDTYLRSATLGFDNEGYIVDSHDRRLLFYLADNGGIITDTIDAISMGAVKKHSVKIDEEGMVSAVPSIGNPRIRLGQITLANFASPTNLIPTRSNRLKETVESGEPILGKPSNNSFGSIIVGSLAAIPRGVFDLGIKGEGYFLLEDNGVAVYSRDDAFYIDNDGFIVNSANQRLVGFAPDALGGVTGARSEINVAESIFPPKKTSEIVLTLNIDSSEDVKQSSFSSDETSTYNHVMFLSVFDSLGIEHSLDIYFKKSNVNTWEVYFVLDKVQASSHDVLTFDENGRIASVNSEIVSVIQKNFSPLSGTSTLEVDIEIQDMTQWASAFNLLSVNQDGYGVGYINDLSINESGLVTGLLSNGRKVVLAQIVLTTFENTNGLREIGNNIWAETEQSGPPQVGGPGTGIRGAVVVN